jgi:hypothetical protein
LSGGHWPRRALQDELNTRFGPHPVNPGPVNFQRHAHLRIRIQCKFQATAKSLGIDGSLETKNGTVGMMTHDEQIERRKPNSLRLASVVAMDNLLRKHLHIILL